MVVSCGVILNQSVILLVEDNPDDEDLTLLALQRNGITNPIVIVRNGAEALDYLFGLGIYSGRNPYETPQLILMDLKLPKLSGLEVLRQIRNHPQTCCIPVVILTTSLEDQDLLESYRLFANSYIQKPVDFTQFVHLIGQLAFYWLKLNQSPPQREG